MTSQISWNKDDLVQFCFPIRGEGRRREWGVLQGGAVATVLHMQSSSVTRECARNASHHISPRATESSLSVQISGWVVM